MRTKDGLKWLFECTNGVRCEIIKNATSGILYVCTSLFFVYICKTLIDIVTNSNNKDIIIYIILLIICIILQQAVSIYNSRLTCSTETQLRNNLQSKFFTHLMDSVYSGKEKFHTGDLTNRLEEDVPIVSDTICRMIPSIIISVVQLTGAIFFLSYMDMTLTFILIFIMPLALVLSKTYMKKIRIMSRTIRNTDSLIQSHIQENIQNRILIRTMEYTTKSVERLYYMQERLFDQTKKRNNFITFSRSLVQFGFMSGYTIAFLWGIFGLKNGTITFGMMTAFIQLVNQIQRPIVDISRQIPAIAKTLTSVERLVELKQQPVESNDNKVFMEGTPGIRIENLSFSYPDSIKNVFKGFSYNFEPGSKTAILGETGVGKSTLLKLLLAILQPTSGTIIMYDKKKEVNLSNQTRCNFSYIPQGNTLVSGTIRDNLLMGDPKASDEKLYEVLHIAAADFVKSMPEGLDTFCGEKGTGMSEGQAQRIALARGLLRPGKIIIMDEPTSSLDKETEQTLIRRLSIYLKDTTLILITHRKEIAKICTSVINLRL